MGWLLRASAADQASRLFVSEFKNRYGDGQFMRGRFQVSHDLIPAGILWSLPASIDRSL